MRDATDFKAKTLDLGSALQLITSNSRVVASMAAAEPRGFLGQIAERCSALDGVTLHCANPSENYPCFSDRNLAGHLEIEVMFLTAAVRSLQGHGSVHYVPQHLSQWARNLTRDRVIDVFWGSCTPPDERGFVSLGPSACYEAEILRAARTVVLEVNPRLPVTYGSTQIPCSWVDHFVPFDHPLSTSPAVYLAEEDQLVAAVVADLVPDGATLQLGIGAIPNAIGQLLAAKRDLGVHSEMINDAIMHLYNSGAITGRRKTLWPGKIVGSFVFGSPELYRFVDRNAAIEMQPSSVVNDPAVLGANHRMISINTAVEIDLTGQVCAESVGHRELSGVGGAWETHVGAQRSVGGRGIIALRSKASATTSKIVCELKPGAKVSVSRNDVDTVVSEFGVARLAGKSVVQRVKAMISLAHPAFRDELTTRANELGYL